MYSFEELTGVNYLVRGGDNHRTYKDPSDPYEISLVIRIHEDGSVEPKGASVFEKWITASRYRAFKTELAEAFPHGGLDWERLKSGILVKRGDTF